MRRRRSHAAAGTVAGSMAFATGCWAGRLVPARIDCNNRLVPEAPGQSSELRVRDRARSGAPGEADAQLLRRHGLRPTRQRLAVLEALRSVDGHPTAEHLHREIDRPGRPLALATVYNTLEALADAGLCRSIDTRDGRRWDSGVDDHVHVRRDRPAEVIDVPHDLGSRLLGSIPEPLLREIEARMDVRIEGLSVELRVR